MDQVGVGGLAAVAAVPAVSAMVDQHAAAVRDILLLGVEGSATVAGAVLLAGYAKGLLDEAGVRFDGLRAISGDGWRQADWLALRLVAVCALSRNDDWRRPATRRCPRRTAPAEPAGPQRGRRFLSPAPCARLPSDS